MLPVIEFKQEKVVMYLTKMKIDELISNSKIMHYDAANDRNYQRPPLPSHYRKIAAYFMKESKPILPSAIIAAMGPEDYEIKSDSLILKNKIRIVDGQHRIEGIKCLCNGYCAGSDERYKELKEEFELPVIIMVIDEADAMIEIDAFINLNSKGKRVKTDLAVALKNQRYQHDIATKDIIDVTENLKNTIAMNVVRKINQNKSGFWKGLIIQPDEIGKRNEQPISIIAFTRAIKPIVDKFFENKNPSIGNSELENIEEQIMNLVEQVWNLVIEKWPECFNSDKSYNNDYNICKGIGVTTLYGIFAENDINDTEFKAFKDILNKSEVTYKDWLVGGTFTGYASAQGFSLIKQFIRGEINKNQIV